MRKGIYGSSAVMVLVIAMTVVATAFASTIVYMETSTARVRHETDGMLANGVPSIDRLTDARASLRQLDGHMDHALIQLIERQPVDVDEIRIVRRKLDADIAAYRAFPAYETEHDLNAELDGELRQLDATQERIVALFGKRDLAAAQELENDEWRQSSDRVDDQLRSLILFNLRHVAHHALRIDNIRRRAAVVGLGVGCGAVLLALAATLIAARAVRRQTWLQEERAHELEMFSARVAHDLMSPMSAVSLAMELVKEQVQEPIVARMAERAVATLKRVRLVVEGLLDFARAGGHPAPDAHARVPQILGEVVDELRSHAESAGVELRCEDAPACDVACAPGILAVLVTNLVHNAIKHMGESTTRRVAVRAARKDDCVSFEIEDTGPGLSPDFATLAFEPYVRGATSSVGLGLGLATVKRLVTAHGGRVGVRAGETAGAIFWFELRVAA
jgi:signal transduction histidine kinase